MNLAEFKERRRLQSTKSENQRLRCMKCLQPQRCCYCHLIEKLKIEIKFVILIHPLEARRRVATGRMSYLCLENSHLFRGHNFTKHKALNEILNDPKLYPVVLYPGTYSKNLSLMSEVAKNEICPSGKILTIIVLDGTWATAKKMLKHSENLKNLPRICFTPERPSQFKVRLQPKDTFVSTIEAIHQTIELLSGAVGYDKTTRKHDQMLKVFQSMVELQLDFIHKLSEEGRPSRYRQHQLEKESKSRTKV